MEIFNTLHEMKHFDVSCHPAESPWNGVFSKPCPLFYAFFFTSWKRTNQHSAQETSSLPKIGRLCRSRLEFVCVFEEESDNGNDAAAMPNHSAIGLFKMFKSQLDKKRKCIL